MAMIAFRLKTAKTFLSAGLLALLASDAGWAQGVVVVDDYNAASPVADSGPTLPELRSQSSAPSSGPTNYGMSNSTSAAPVRNQAPMRSRAMMEGVPPEMLSEGMETGAESETKPGLLSKLPRWKMPRIFGDDSQEQPEQPVMQEQMPREQQAPTPQATYRGPRRLSRQTGPQSIGTFASQQPEQQQQPKRTPRLPSWSLKKLFGSEEESEEAVPTIGDGAAAAGYEGRAFRGSAQGSPAARSTPLPSNNRFSNPNNSNAASQRGPMNGIPAKVMQADGSQANLPAEGDVTQAGYTQRNGGMQLRPANNRPASLLGGNPNPTPHYRQPATGNSSQMGQGQANNAFNRGPETIERLSQNKRSQSSQTPAMPAPKSQPVFVSDDSNAPSEPKSNGTPNMFRSPQADRPLISTVSPQMETQSPASPQSELSLASAEPQMIQNDAAMNFPQRPQTARNPVPMNAKRETPASVAKPSDRAVELLAQANGVAQSAETEEQITQVVQMCRQVLAIDQSPQAIQYSKTLAAWALNRRGEMRADTGHDREAMLDFEDAIHTDPSLWRAVHNRGVMLAQQGQFATAFDDFNRTVELNPKFAKAYSNRAALYMQAGDLTAALDDYRQAITLDPDLAVAHKGRGRVCHMVGNFEESLQHFDAAVLLAPGDAHIALGRADLLTDMGRYAAAIEGYQQTIALDSANHAAYRSLAWVQATCPDESFRNAEQALVNAEQALQHAGQEDDVTLDTLAAAQANAGDFAAAQSTQVKAIELAPASEKSLYQERLAMYQSNQPFRTEAAQPIRQATYRR